MLRISKLTDYAIVLCAELASGPQSARELCEATGMGSATASKVLKQLHRTGLVVSVRGAHGGYSLARPAREIDVAELIVAMEGPISVTECSDSEACDRDHHCTTKPAWRRINDAVREALASISLAEIVDTSNLVPFANLRPAERSPTKRLGA